MCSGLILWNVLPGFRAIDTQRRCQQGFEAGILNIRPARRTGFPFVVTHTLQRLFDSINLFSKHRNCK